MAKIILNGYILVPDSDLASVLAEMETHAELTRNEPGCLAFDINQDQADRHRINVYEEFTDKESFAFHQQRTRKSFWSAVSANAERHYKITGLD